MEPNRIMKRSDRAGISVKWRVKATFDGKGSVLRLMPVGFCNCGPLTLCEETHRGALGRIAWLRPAAAYDSLINKRFTNRIML